MASAARLRSLPLFADVPDDDLALFAATARWERYPAGTVVMREGEEGSFLLIVVEGSFEVAVAQGPSRTVLGTVGVGELLGEAVLFRRSVQRSAEVKAVTEAEALRLEASDLETLVRTRSAVPRAIELAVLRTLSRRIQVGSNLVSEMLKSEETASTGFFSRLKGLMGR